MRSYLSWLFASFVFAAAPAHAEWFEAKSKHFMIYADESQKELRAYAEKLERFDQAVRYVRGMEDRSLTDSERVTIFVLPDMDSVGHLIHATGIGGFYRTTASGSYAFVPANTNYMVLGDSGGVGRYDSGLSPEAIFFHEYSHHLQFSEASEVIPTWASEGFAEFFATATINKDGSVSIGRNPGYRWSDMQIDSSLPLEDMVGAKTDKLDWGGVEALYARGWLLTHYLTMTVGRKGQLNKYLADIQQGMAPLNSARDAFGDLKELDHELNGYARQNSYLGFTVSANVISVGNVSLRPLTPAESAIIRVRIQSKAGVDDKTARNVAAQARSIAANYPNDEMVQSELAEAEFDAKDYEGAELAARKALAVNPDNVHALIYEGRAQVELAKQSPKTADWESIRRSFLKANKIDTENAEPLAYYYESFGAAGEQPTQNAIDGLLYAVDLAPRDQSVRISAVGALIAENKLKQASEMFAPVAYDPHLKAQVRELAVKVMAALDEGDSNSARSLLDKASEASKKVDGN